MILTVTLNPTVDKAYEVEKLVPGEVIRVGENRQAAAGKGVQVAKVARLLGEEVTATGFLGGHNGQFIKDKLASAGIRTEFIETDGETRTCVNIRDLSTGRMTELLESGLPVPPEKIQEFLERYRELLADCEVVALCGSVPPGIGTDFYPMLIRLAKEAGKTVLFDSSGKLLKEGMKACPHLIKPNRDELTELIGHSLTGLDDIISAASEIRRTAIQTVIVSLGKDGAVFVTEDGAYQGTTPDIPIVNTVGCGDSMVAGYAAGIRRGLPITERIKLAMAVSTANALHKETGFFVPEDMDRLLGMVGAFRL